MPAADIKTEVERLLERLRDPIQLRLAITALMVLVGYAGIYMPLNKRIEEMTRELSDDRTRQNLAGEIVQLRNELDKFQARLPEDTDTNEWVQYVIDGVRRFPLKLVNLISDDSQRVGPYEAVVLRLEVTGKFRDLDAFLHWLESNPRLFRADSAKISPSRCDSGYLVMQLTLLGAKA